MSFLTRLLLVTLLSGPCIPQNQEEFILLTLKSIAARQDSLHQKFDVFEDKILAHHELLEDKLLAHHEQLENLKLSVGRCSTKHQISTFHDLLATNIDGCEDNSNVCGDEKDCINLNGNYTCICKDGYEKEGDICQDIDEWSEENKCHEYATYTNTQGSNICQCLPGYDGDGYTCTDIDECSVENKCSVHASCTNTPGGFTCKCSPGREGDGYICKPTGFVCTSPSLELQPFGCITYVEEHWLWGGMTWSDAQAKCNQEGGSLLYGFTTKQQLITIVQHLYQHFEADRDVRSPWVGVRGGLFVKSPSDDGPPGGNSSITMPHKHLWFDGEPTGTLGDDTQCALVSLDPSNTKLWDYECSSLSLPSLCQILY